jgi:hypothetical protein
MITEVEYDVLGRLNNRLDMRMQATDLQLVPDTGCSLTEDLMPRQIPNDWPINGHYEPFAAIHPTPEEISERHPVDWERYHENGLGRAAIAGFFLADGGYYMLRHLYEAPRPATEIMLAVDTVEPELKIEEICEDFGFTSSDIEWFRRGLRFHNADLYRQDDNGVEVRIGRFPFRADAAARLRQLAFGGHKQFYEIRTADRDTMSMETDSNGFLVKPTAEQVRDGNERTPWKKHLI